MNELNYLSVGVDIVWRVWIQTEKIHQSTMYNSVAVVADDGRGGGGGQGGSGDTKATIEEEKKMCFVV